MTKPITTTLKTAIISVFRAVADTPTPKVPEATRRCEHCGSELEVQHRTSSIEILVNAACVVALLAVLFPAIWIGQEWLSCRVHHYLEHPVWHEPLDDWNLN
jgi:hypothetical protein